MGAGVQFTADIAIQTYDEIEVVVIGNNCLANGTLWELLVQCGVNSLVEDLLITSRSRGYKDDVTLMGNEASILISPNPASEIVFIESKLEFINLVSIFNTNGNLLLTELVNAKSTSINVSDIPQGIYNIVIEQENNFITKRLVLIK